MLVILRQGLHLFPKKEAHFPTMQPAVRFMQQMKVLMHSYYDCMM